MMTRKQPKIVFFGYLFFLSLFAGEILAFPSSVPSTTKRHVFIIQPGIDMIWGNYLFALNNDSKATGTGKGKVVESQEQLIEVPLMLPKEILDFRVAEGLSPEDIVLGDGGSADLKLRKKIKPGTALAGISFNAAAEAGSSVLSIPVRSDVNEILVMSPKGSLRLESESGGELSQGQAFAGQSFDILRFENPKLGETLVVRLTGIPEGRRRYWYLGFFSGGVLLLTAFGFAWRTRPEINGGA